MEHVVIVVEVTTIDLILEIELNPDANSAKRRLNCVYNLLEFQTS